MKRIALMVALLAAGTAQALANDTTAELKAGGLEFTHTDSVSMEEEKLYLSPKEVRVDYVFLNTSDKPVETYVAFPMPDVGGGIDMNVDAGDTESDNFMGFSVMQNEQPLKASLQQRVYISGIDMTDVVKGLKLPLNPMSQKARDAIGKLDAATIEDLLARGLVYTEEYDDGSGMKKAYGPLWTLKSTFWWKTSFPPGQKVTVAHKYRPSVGGTVATTFLDENNEPKGERYEEYLKKYCIDDAFVKLARQSNADMTAGNSYLYENWMSYVLTTGANWAGPIKKFTLTVDKGEPDNFVSFCGKGVKKIGPTTFQMTATDFYPEKDIDLLLLIPSQAP